MGLFSKKNKEKPTKPEKQAKVKKTSRSNNSNTSSDISEIARKYNIRVSAPHGYYPEDVDKVIADLDNQLTLLSKENMLAESKITRVTEERDSLKSQLTKLKLQISTMEFPDTSSELDTAMMSKFNTINPSAGDIPADVPEHVENNIIQPVTMDSPVDDETDDESGQEVYDDLVSKATRSYKEEVLQPEVVKNIDEILPSTDEQPVEITKQPKQKSRRHEQKTVFDLEILGGNEDA